MIAVEGLSLRQGRFALDGVTFAVPAGRYGVLMGRTGCGKTSILEAVAGLRPVAGGRVLLAERDVTALPPAARGVGYVPQDGALFKTMTVRDHLAFALELRREPAGRVARRVADLAGWLGLTHLLERRPHGLSGGEAQRVALGRALAFEPHYLLLDEPLSSLDDETRGQLVGLLDGLRQRREVTVLHVTHSRAEADALADVLFVLADGRVRPAAEDASPRPRPAAGEGITRPADITPG
jgi:ABC-type sugar transport system ATPase subunit